MSILSRITKLEAAQGITQINVANELKRLKELALSAEAPPKTITDYEAKIKACNNPELIQLYQAAIRANN